MFVEIRATFEAYPRSGFQLETYHLNVNSIEYIQDYGTEKFYIDGPVGDTEGPFCRVVTSHGTYYVNGTLDELLARFRSA